ncbi:MAG: Fe-S cluster assembly protein SufD [Chloroflexi bacterium]|nr:Fe-S cluster assembly protein SufD [Chloroflexota bacterium]OJV91978.1 MAG: Fe-S cluster assembly protein SufD [Chloroflexi bacterium 54-19]
MPSLVQGLSWEAAEQYSAQNNEPEWLREKRRAGWEAFLNLPTPDWSRGIRGWWSSVLKPLAFDELTPFTTAGAGSLPANLDLDNPQDAPAGLIVQHNTENIRLELSEEARAKGVVLSSLTEAVKTHPEIVKQYFMTRCVPVDEDRFTAVHAAFWNGGVFLYVPKNVVIEQPFRSIYYTDQAQAALFSHTLVVTGANAKVRLIEEHLSNGQAGDAPVLDSGVTEIFVGENSQVEYYNPQEYGENVTSIAVKRSMVGPHAIQRWIVATLGGDTSRLTLESVMEGEGAHAETTGLAFPIHNQHFDTQFRQLHTVPHTTANSVFKQVLNDDSQLGFKGGIRTLKKAQFTDSFLQVHTLYLNDASKADILPFLDVDANDVRCAHGATTGKIDKDQIFYLQSRGLSLTEAEEMIVAGFFEEGIQRIPLESVQERLRESIQTKLEG